jgi:hypothetical protein
MYHKFIILIRMDDDLNCGIVCCTSSSEFLLFLPFSSAFQYVFTHVRPLKQDFFTCIDRKLTGSKEEQKRVLSNIYEYRKYRPTV